MNFVLKVDEMFREYLISRIEKMGGVLYTFMFPNGYGASVVKHEFSYGYEDDCWELAVMVEIDGRLHLCYNTPITDDTEGYLTDENVNNILHEIFELNKEEM